MKTLIEKILPVKEISEEAKKEKKGRPPTFEMHYWWTRKPLVTARAVVLGSLLPENFDIDEFKQLLGLGRRERAFKYNLMDEQIKNLHQHYKQVWGTKTPTVFDPFAGGGSIPFEALRMGCNVVANDYNPVAWLIMKSTLEHPIKYEKKLVKDLEKVFDDIFKKLKAELGELYPTHNGKEVAAYIYAWVVKCPKCGFETPLVGSWWLARKKNKQLYLQHFIKDSELHFEIERGENIPPPTCVKANGYCLNCGSKIGNADILSQINSEEKEKLLTVVLLGNKGKEYHLPNEEDLSAFETAKEILKTKLDSLITENLIPTEKMALHTVRAAKYLEQWYRLLNPRQLLLMATLTKLIREKVREIAEKEEKEYALAIGTYLAIWIGKHINYNCRLTTYLDQREGIVPATANKLNALQWDHTEVNPFSRSNGSLTSAFCKGVIGSINFVEKVNGDMPNVNVLNSSIFTVSSDKFDIIITDPPYYNDAPYAELSEFFFVWESRAIGEYMKEQNKMFEQTNTLTDEDISVSYQRDKNFFELAFKKACQKLHELLSDNGILTMFFAHSSVEAWDFVVNALRKANFRITATWPIHTESLNIANVGKESFQSSIVVVARKRKEDKTGYIEEIQEEVEKHLKKRLQEFWDYGLRGADLTVAAMGASLDILTQYSEIKSYTGELKVKDILKLVQRYVAHFILERFVGNTELDGATAFYVYCRFSDLRQMPYDTANLIAKSLDIDLKDMEKKGLIDSVKSGKAKGVKVLSYRERGELEEVRTLIDAVHRVMYAFEKGGLRAVESVIVDLPYGPSEVRDVLRAFLYLDSSDVERQVAQQVLGSHLTPEEGQVSISDFERKK